MNEVIVRKLNPENEETWRYSGQVLRQRADSILLEAYFNRNDLPFHGITFGKGDRFVEIYFNNRWYNIFEIHDREDDHLKGWYCNVTRPAEFKDGEISYVDLALDLLVFPGGDQLVLDEDEFDALNIDDSTRQGARQALDQLKAIFQSPLNWTLEEQQRF